MIVCIFLDSILFNLYDYLSYLFLIIVFLSSLTQIFLYYFIEFKLYTCFFGKLNE